MAAKRKSKGAKAKAAFDEAALNKLTAKIDTELSHPQSKEQTPARKSVHPDKPRANSEATNSKSKNQLKARHHNDQTERPDKRKRDEHESKDAHPKKRQAQEAKTALAKPKALRDTKVDLLDEIKLLGGDEADLDLVAGIDSDAEEVKAPKSKSAFTADKALKTELLKFAAGLGFDEIQDEDAATDEEMEAYAQAQEEEEDDQEDDQEEISEVKEEAPPAEKSQGRSAAGKLVFEPRPDWHTVSEENLPAPASDDARNFYNFASTMNNLKAYAKTLLETDAAAYETMVAKSSTRKFMSTIMTSGTMSDKVSALTLAIQESPVHNTKTLETLVTLAGKKSREQAIAALGALIDLLGNGVVLPRDRRLRLFSTQPGLIGTLQTQSLAAWTSEKPLPGKITKTHLIMWAYEDWLKETYFKIIQLLELWCADEIEYSRSRCLDFVFGLLRDKPEQEANLLRLLVNKLGDREKKIASRTSYLILQLLTTHPAMKGVVIKAIEHEVLLRPNQTIRPKYYAITTLNQTILTSNEPQVADTLVRIYFDLFVALLKIGALDSAGSLDEKNTHGGKKKFSKGKKETDVAADKSGVAPDTETAEKMVSAILSGLNRALPFSNTDDETLECHLDTLFKITHSSNFNTAIQALMLVQQLTLTKHVAVDQFYRTLYESLLDVRLIRSSKQALYLNLLYRSLKNDVDVRRVKAFVKRMLQICYLHDPSFVCGILFLVAQLEGTFPDLKTLLNEPEEDGKGEEFLDAPTKVNDSEAPRGHSGHEFQVYDGRRSDPRYADADQSCLWEVVPYFKHFHPSVSVFAENLLVKQKTIPKPELANHTLINFLDKFVYKNAKATDSRRGASIMQPVLAAGSAAHVVVPGRSSAKNQANVNSAAFWNKKQEDVAAEDVFFHAYFSQIGKPGQDAKGKKNKKDVVGNDGDEIDEDEIWGALVNSRPDVEGDDEEADLGLDNEDDMSDLGSLLDMSDDEEEDSVDTDADLVGGNVEMIDEEDGSDSGALFSDSEEEQDEAEEPTGKDGTGKMRKRELKKLPTFATADDYAALLGQDEDETYSD